MEMYLTIYRTPLAARQLAEYRAFLEACGLRDEEDADLVAWMTDDEARLVACGALAGHTIKQLAVAPEAEGQGVMATVISALISEAAAGGITRLFLCTKPANRQMFGSLGFYPVVETPDAVLMENRRGGADDFIASIPVYEGVRGAVVCNCDPFTLGHRHLIEHAASRCGHLYVFAVSESGSAFTPEERLDMIRRGTADIVNCHVYASDLYLISRATFPAYFIKDRAHAEEVRADLDIGFFAGCLAPALGITKRFVGCEPLDPVTRAYNERMRELLPQRGIEFEEIPRLTDGSGEYISAGRVRALMKEAAGLSGQDREEVLDKIKALVPQTTFETIEKHL
ncbi:MAG: GNAT family N-acetyltransferase [Mogibacterium sp.]|nr:GNAT family N-acetyltransferase [Mogibacterium sp.]